MKPLLIVIVVGFLIALAGLTWMQFSFGDPGSGILVPDVRVDVRSVTITGVGLLLFVSGIIIKFLQIKPTDTSLNGEFEKEGKRNLGGVDGMNGTCNNGHNLEVINKGDKLKLRCKDCGKTFNLMYNCHYGYHPVEEEKK